MPKDYIQDLQQITMYSKIGRYISNKLLKYRSSDKKNATLTERPSFNDNMEARTKMSMTTQGFNINPNKVNSTMLVSKDQKISQARKQKAKKTKKGRDDNSKQQKQNIGQNTSNRASSQSKNNNEQLRSNIIKGKESEFHPSVGHYKINYGLTQKTTHLYDFNRSVPHFYNQNKRLNQATPVLKEYPDGFFKNSKGFKELKRMAGRQNIKGSIRKNLENPHENRYILHQDFNSIDKQKSPIKMDKITPRDNRMFKNMENSPDYDYNFQINKRKLASHLVPFERQTQRKGQMFLAKTGISQQFMSYNISPENTYRSVLWNKALNRQKNGLVPSYLDKTIHSRLAISMANFKTLQMNCSDMRVSSQLNKGQKKLNAFKDSSRVVYVEQQQV